MIKDHLHQIFFNWPQIRWKGFVFTFALNSLILIGFDFNGVPLSIRMLLSFFISLNFTAPFAISKSSEYFYLKFISLISLPFSITLILLGQGYLFWVVPNVTNWLYLPILIYLVWIPLIFLFPKQLIWIGEMFYDPSTIPGKITYGSFFIVLGLLRPKWYRFERYLPDYPHTPKNIMFGAIISLLMIALGLLFHFYFMARLYSVYPKRKYYFDSKTKKVIRNDNNHEKHLEKN